MIVVSVLLVVVACVLLGVGLVSLDEPLLYSAIGVSAVAALALVVGVRRLATVRVSQGLITVRPAGATLALGAARLAPATGRATSRPVGRATPRPMGRAAVGYPPDAADLDAPDEPPVQQLSPADAARVARLDAEVLVADGRPRYHMAGCAQLPGPDDAEAIAVAEAVELGFTPCDRCRPASALLRASRED